MSELQTAGHKLKTVRPLAPYLTLAHPQLKTTGGGIRGRSWSTWGGQALVLAQTILARYLSRPGYWARLGLVFKMDSIGQSLQTHQTWLKLAPRLLLKLAFRAYPPSQLIDWGSQRLPSQLVYSSIETPYFDRPSVRSGVLLPVPELSGQPLAHRLREREVVVVASTRRQLSQHFISREQRIQHLLTRGQRVEAGTAVGGATLQPTPASRTWLLPFEPEIGISLPKVRPVPRIVHRPTAAQVEVARRPAAATTRPANDMVAPPTNLSHSAASSPVFDLNRLTDQVVQTIDRRIIAQRERLGRI